MVTIEELNVYPLKSGRAIAKQSVRIGRTGFEWDRNWMAVDRTSKFLSQRTHPLLAQIVPEVVTDALVLTAPGRVPLRVPHAAAAAIDAVEGGPPEDSHVTVKVWDDTCEGIDQGDVAALWLTSFLGEDVRLVRVVSEPQRVANPQYAGTGRHTVAFSDGFPILVVNRASLEDLNTRMPEAVPMNRFRPNIVLGGLPAFAEDRIDAVRMGDVELRLVKPCTRCIITSTDQQTGDRTTNPLPVLRTFRFDRALLGVTFGENAIVTTGVGAFLEVGREAVVTFEA
jgi:MOSC domain-containing protein